MLKGTSTLVPRNDQVGLKFEAFSIIDVTSNACGVLFHPSWARTEKSVVVGLNRVNSHFLTANSNTVPPGCLGTLAADCRRGGAN
jgi:hypothetical protein